MHRLLVLAPLAIIMLAQGGCISASITRNVTTGQELVDLQKAHASGAITDTEYVALKSQMVSAATSGSVESQPSKP